MSSDKKTTQRSVYVVRLSSEAGKDPKVRRQNPNRDPSKPCIYVGETGLTVEERYQNHKKGYKASVYVKKYGSELMPELYEHLNPLPWQKAKQMEKDLAEHLRRAGFTVTGGH